MIGVSSDYAVLDCEAGSFYYGYECFRDSEWCFLAKRPGRENLTIPFSELGLNDGEKHECTSCLLAGIGVMLERDSSDSLLELYRSWLTRKGYWEELVKDYPYLQDRTKA